MRHFNLEGLESRDVPATWGNPWPDAAHLTISFAPDGTDIAGQASEMNKALDAVAPRAVWQTEVVKAFQAWAEAAGVNFGVVADGGLAFGSAGRPQADPRFGDIRIAAGHFGDSVLAFSSPFDVTAGTWSGDVRINLDALPTVNGVGGPDLYTMMLQEAGHVLGLGNSEDTGSVMFEEYGGPRAGLGASDVTAIQALYGARPGDSFEGASGNGTFANASRLGWLQDAGGVLAIQADADLSKAGDVDLYKFTAPSLTGSFKLTLQRDGLSLVTPKVTLYDAQGRVVASASSSDPDGGDLTINVSKLSLLSSYYVKVESAGAFAVGSYRLRAEYIPLVNGLLGGLTSTVQSVGQTLTNNDLHTNDSLFTATNLLSGLFGPKSSFDVAYQASISDKSDVDFYKMTAAADAPGVLQVMAWGTGNSAVQPRVSLLDASGKVLATQVLTAEGGSVAIQFEGVQAGATYYVRVDGGGTTGNYFLGADFRATPTKLASLASGNLSGSQSGTLEIARAGLMHFVLESHEGGVRLDVLDSAGKVVATTTAASGQAASLTAGLQAGAYTVRLTSLRTDGKPAVFSLKGLMLSDPIGPQAEDPSAAPSKSPPPSGQQTTTTRNPDGSTTTTTTNPDGSTTTTTTYRDGRTTTTTSQPPPPQEPPPPSEPTYSWYTWTWQDPYAQESGGAPKAEAPSSGGYRT